MPFSSSRHPSPRKTCDATTLRLAAIAKVWGAVKFVHPSLGYRNDLDGDAAGMRAAERARGNDLLASIVTETLEPVGRVA